MDDIYPDPDIHWSDVWYESHHDAVVQKDFSKAMAAALRAALEARRHYRLSHDIEDVCHGAFFYLLAAKAADKVKADRNMIRMYFMSEQCWQDASSYLSELPEDLKLNLTATRHELNKLKRKVSALGVDPNMDPRIFIRTEMRIDGIEI